MTPLESWLETEIGKRFPDGEDPIPVGQLRVRVAHLCFNLLDQVEKLATSVAESRGRGE